MQFEGMLARRYISTQKRHSALTILSIIAALAMMTVLMTCFTTMTECMHAREKNVRPYHIEMYSVTAEQAEKLKTYPQVYDVRLSEYEEPDEEGAMQKYYNARFYLEKGIGDITSWYDKLCESLNRADFSMSSNDALNGTFNRDLLNYEDIDEEANFNKVISYAGYSIYLIILALILRLVIDTAFEVSSKERERQFGVLQSVGATPNQIRGIIIREGMILSVIGVPVGIGIGVGLGYGLFQIIIHSGLIDAFFESEAKAMTILQYHIDPMLLLICAAVGFAWVYLSAAGTGARVIRMTPIQAISNRSNTIKKVKKHSLFGLFFGWEGKLASRNARRQPKRFIVTVLSLTLSISMFGMFTILIDNFEDVVEDAIMMSDGIGPCTYDFSMAQMEYVREPLGYQKGYELIKNNELFIEPDLHFITHAAGKSDVSIYYVNEQCYSRLFYKIDMPMTYAELEKSGGYLAFNCDEDSLSADSKQITVTTQKLTEISDEMKEKYTEDELDEMLRDDNNTTLRRTIGTVRSNSVQTFDLSDDDWNLGGEGGLEKVYCTCEETERTLDVVGNVKSDYVLTNRGGVKLVAPVSKYEKEDNAWYGIAGKLIYLNVKLRGNDDYQAAMQFFKNNGSEFSGVDDHFNMMRQIRSVLTAFKIGGTFFIIMFGLIALINMINIVSTGILNRKSELASMQCVGMTDGQLYGMTIIECAQFVIIALVAAIILCALATWGTQTFLNNAIGLEASDVENMRGNVGTFAAVPRILIASGCAFFAALAASILPLRRMQRETLVDRIRKVE